MNEAKRKQLLEKGYTEEQINELEGLFSDPKDIKELPEDVQKQITDKIEAAKREIETATETIVSNQFRKRLDEMKGEIMALRAASDPAIRAAQEKAAEEEKQKVAEEQARLAKLTGKEQLALVEERLNRELTAIREQSAGEVASLKEELRQKDLEVERARLIQEHGLTDFVKFIPDTKSNPSLTRETLVEFVEEAKKMVEKYKTSTAGAPDGGGARKSKPIIEGQDSQDLGNRNPKIERRQIRNMSEEEIDALIDKHVPEEFDLD